MSSSVTASSPMHQGNRGRSQSGASTSVNDEGLQILSAFYTRTYPSADELTMSLDEFTEGELEEAVTELRNEVAALREETDAMQHQADELRRAAAATAPGSSSPQRAPGVGLSFTNDDGVESTGVQTPSKGTSASASNVTVSASTAAAAAAGSSTGVGGGGTRRGQRYRRKSATMGELVQYVRVEDKMKLLEMEMNRLHEQESRQARGVEQMTDSLVATAEEAKRRMKELRLEVMQLHREVLDPETGEATADELVRYLRRREIAQRSYLDKLLTQCASTEVEMRRAQAQARQRRAAGEAFQPIDFDQLRIENQQFTERLEKKNAELAALKAMSTRTVQSLNALTDALNAITAEQARLKRESKSRTEYLMRCRQDVQVATKEAAQAAKKNEAIKSQQEAVKVPKIEEYIAQKAELYELEKALANWRRKVEIAEGQVAVVRQQTRKLKQQQKLAEDYAESRRQRSRGSLARGGVASTASPGRRTGGGGGGFGIHGGALGGQGPVASGRGVGRGGRGGRGVVSMGGGAKTPHTSAPSADGSVTGGPSPHQVAQTVNINENELSAAPTPTAGKSNSNMGLSSQVLVGGAGKAVLEAKRAATPPVAATLGSDGVEADVTTE